MKVAMVIQNSLRSLGGGELVCMSTCLALQELGYHVKLISDRFEPDEIETAFGMGEVMRNCEHIKVPEIGRKLARFSSLPGIYFAWRSRRFLEKQSADVIFVTRDPRRPDVLPDRPFFRFTYEVEQLRDFWENYHLGVKFAYRSLYGRNSSRTTFLAVSSTVLEELKHDGYRAVELVYPSYGRGFRVRPKKRQVVQVTFLAPQKRIDDFMEVARRLPQYRFFLVGRDTERMNRIYRGYAKRVLSNMPSNVGYVESRIRQFRELLEESKVYLHTGIEPGMTIAVMESVSAGCMPVAPRQGGGGEVIDAVGVGFRYHEVQDCVDFIRSEMGEGTETIVGRSRGLTPIEIAERARVFSPEAFRARIRDVIARWNNIS
jgi:glycosyltransferase involved in cell wall biosynthesis